MGKKGKIPWTDRMVSLLYERFWAQRGERWDRKLKGQLRLLHPVSEQELTGMVSKYRKEQIRLVLVCSLILCVFLIGAGLRIFLPVQEIEIERGGYGEGERSETVYPGQQEPIEFTVGEREYTKEELEQAFKDGFLWLRQQMLLDNDSAAQVRSDLNFPVEVPGGIKAEWISTDPEVILEDGTVQNDNWSESQKELVTVTVLLTYGEEIRRQELHFMVKAPILSSEEGLRRKIRTAIEQIEKETRHNLTFRLPGVIENTKIQRIQSGRQMGGIFFLLLILFFLLFYKKHNSLQEQMAHRKEEIQEDYPLIVNKLVLYLSAGVNTRAAFEKICAEYQEDRQNGRLPFRFAYQEMYVMLNQLKAGVPERKAYEDYGSRTGETNYLKFMALIVQNLQKGNTGLLQALSEEEERAFAKRLDRAKKKGEEAGTKLLFPMLVLLIVVMAIVMLPAVFQFQNY